MKVDYIVVGQGLAGTTLAYSLMKEGQKVIVISDREENSSSHVAAGVYNPITGRRLVKTWMADELFPFAISFYKKLEKELNCSFVHENRIYKPFSSITEENDLVAKTEDQSFAKYCNLKIDNSRFKFSLKNDAGGVEITHSGNLDVKMFTQAFEQYLLVQEAIIFEKFDHSALSTEQSGIKYKDLAAKKIFFCEGYRAADNHLFSWLPFTPTKGEILEVKIDNMPSSHIINKGGFLVPQSNGNFLSGATYERKTDKAVTEGGKEAVEEKMKGYLKLPYKVINQRAGVRPAIKDRRPVMGPHPKMDNIYIFNGLGTKGVTLGPYFAHQLAQHLLKGEAIQKEVNISRYYSLYQS